MPTVLRIPPADMSSYKSQQELELKAEVAHKAKDTALDNSDRGYHYGLVFINASEADKEQLTSLMSVYVDIS